MQVEPYLTLTEAAGYLRCTPERIRHLITIGDLEPTYNGEQALLRREDLDGFVTNYFETYDYHGDTAHG